MAAVERLSFQRWAPSWIKYQHLARYHWAVPFTQGKRVIDAACGTGYGSEIIIKGGAKSVHGFDIAQDAIDEATRMYPQPNLTFQQADIRQLPLPENSADVYLSFETIEHLESPRDYLQEAVRVLSPQGVFICSTPNRKLTNPGIKLTDKPFNQHHYREYLPEELIAELQPFFARIELWDQSCYSSFYASLMGTAGRLLPMLAVRMHQVNKLLFSPLDSQNRHTPTLGSKRVPEMMIAICNKS
jgi:O-antigen biosynthesis protein